MVLPKKASIGSSTRSDVAPHGSFKKKCLPGTVMLRIARYKCIFDLFLFVFFLWSGHKH